MSVQCQAAASFFHIPLPSGFDIDDRGFVDSAGVLAESVRYATAQRNNREDDPFDLEIEMAAIVHPKIGMRRELEAFGFNIFERDVPVDLDKVFFIVIGFTEFFHIFFGLFSSILAFSCAANLFPC
jgi:hypothetical protein